MAACGSNMTESAVRAGGGFVEVAQVNSDEAGSTGKTWRHGSWLVDCSHKPSSVSEQLVWRKKRVKMTFNPPS